MPRLLLTLALLCLSSPALAGFRFASIDGGVIDLDDWAGKPILVVNTASLCGYADQFDDLQALHEEFGPMGVLVLAVPSDDFQQELATEAEVKEFCAVSFDLTLPMATITPVKGQDAHPFYAFVRAETGFTPRWNFNKVLIAPDGTIAGTWGAGDRPEGPVRQKLLTLLP
jgi:glutathione peroxidase